MTDIKDELRQYLSKPENQKCVLVVKALEELERRDDDAQMPHPKSYAVRFIRWIYNCLQKRIYIELAYGFFMLSILGFWAFLTLNKYVTLEMDERIRLVSDTLPACLYAGLVIISFDFLRTFIEITCKDPELPKRRRQENMQKIKHLLQKIREFSKNLKNKITGRSERI